MIYHPLAFDAASDGQWGRRKGGGKAVRVAYPWEGVKVSSSMYAHIRRNPRFAELVAKRTRFAGILAAICLLGPWAAIGWAPAFAVKLVYGGALGFAITHRALTRLYGQG